MLNNIPTLNGDVSQYLGKELTGGDQGNLNQQFGYDPSRSNYDFQANGNIYTVKNNNNGTRSVSQTDTVANRLAKQQQQQAADLAAKQKAALDQQFANNKQEVSQFNSDFTNATNNAVNSAYDKFNIPNQTAAVNALRNRIADLGLNLNNTGQGGYASSSQVDKALNTNYLPNMSLAESALGTSTNAAQQEIQTQLQPYLEQAKLLGTRIASEMTGFTAQQKNELDGLLTAMNNGASLTNAQLQRMQDLALTEEQFGIQRQKNMQDFLASIFGNTYQTVPAGGSVVDVTNGNTVGNTNQSLDLSGIGGYNYDTSGNSSPSTSSNQASNLNDFVSNGNTGGVQPYYPPDAQNYLQDNALNSSGANLNGFNAGSNIWGNVGM